MKASLFLQIINHPLIRRTASFTILSGSFSLTTTILRELSKPVISPSFPKRGRSCTSILQALGQIKRPSPQRSQSPCAQEISRNRRRSQVLKGLLESNMASISSFVLRKGPTTLPAQTSTMFSARENNSFPPSISLW